MQKAIFIILCLLFGTNGVLQAVLIDVTHQDTKQDPLFVPPRVHELGNNPPFPTDEWIDSGDLTADHIPCTQDYDPSGPPNVEVWIKNNTGKIWTDLWYVADPETALTNDDGLVNNELAFKIDWIGVNTPLVSESINLNGIFEVNETWNFVIQNYGNALGLPPSAFASLALVGNTSGGDQVSSGSIIAIPEPATFLLLGFGGLWLNKRRK